MSEAYVGIQLDYDQERIWSVELPVKKGTAEVMFMGDMHYGSESQATSHLYKYLNLIKKKPDMRVVIMGDIFEFGELSSFLIGHDEPSHEQIKMFVEDFLPIGHQVVGMVPGNHDNRFARLIRRALDLYEFLKSQLGQPYIITVPPNRGALVVFKVGEQAYPVYVLHSSTRAQVNMEVQLKRSGGIWTVPLIAHGHTHKMAWVPRTFFSVAKIDNEFYRSVNRQYLLSTGCFLRYPAYAEATSMPVPDVGAPIIRFHADECDIEYVDTRVAYKSFFARSHKWKKGKMMVELPPNIPSRQCPKCKSIDTWFNGSGRIVCRSCNTTSRIINLNGSGDKRRKP